MVNLGSLSDERFVFGFEGFTGLAEHASDTVNASFGKRDAAFGELGLLGFDPRCKVGFEFTFNASINGGFNFASGGFYEFIVALPAFAPSALLDGSDGDIAEGGKLSQADRAALVLGANSDPVAARFAGFGRA